MRIDRFPITITLNKKVLDDFKKITSEKFINRSELIESFIEKWLKENTKTK